MAYLFALLLLMADVAHASQTPHDKAVAAWNACEDAMIASDEARRIEDIAGRTGVVDLVYEKCGPRPVVTLGHGRLALDGEDCAALFNWSRQQVCVPDDTVVLDLFARHLDQRVFDRRKYAERCQRDLAAGRAGDYQSFRAEVCESGGKRKPKH